MSTYLRTTYDLNDRALVDALDDLPLWSAPFGLKLLDAVPMQPGMTVLDIGFGLGFPALELAMRLGPSARVYGIDPWTAGIERAQRKLAVYGIRTVELLEGVAEDLPLDDELVDLVVSNNGINNVADIPAVLAEVCRVLKPGGRFMMTMNLERSMQEFYNVYRDVLRDCALDDRLDALERHIYERRRPIGEMTAMIAQAGLTVRTVDEDVFRLRYANGTAMLNHFSVGVAFLGGWKDILQEEQREQVFDAIEQRLNDSAGDNGGLSLSIPFVLIDCKK